MKSYNVLALLGLFLALLTAGASAELIAYEGFDIEGLAAGAQVRDHAGATSFGFNGLIRYSTSAPETGKFVTDSLVGLVVTPKTLGGSVIQSGSNSRFYRDLSAPMVEGTFYVSFLMSAGQNIALDISNGDWNSNVKASIGVGSSTTDGPKLTVGSNVSGILAPRNEVHFYVVKIVLASGSGTVSVFVDPEFSAYEPAVANASFTTSFSSGFAFWADRFRFGRFNSNTNAYLDEIRLGRTFVDVYPKPGDASNIAPADRAVDVPQDSVLQWQIGDDPNAPGQPWSAVQGFYVNFGENPYQLALQTPTMLPTTTTTLTPPALAKDKTYYWQVVEVFEHPQGGLRGPTDPNNIFSAVWTFKTPLTVPLIVEDLPAMSRFLQGSDQQLSITVESVSPPQFAWYYSVDNVVGGDTGIGTNSDTLLLTGIDVDDQGYYYCVVGNDSGVDVTSVMTQLVINRMLAWYQFENNLDDAIGANDATGAGHPMTYTAGIVTADAQAYAADPNGGMYGELPAGCYPKAGIGNGLERFTYSAWVKLADSTKKGSLLGSFNFGATTAMRLTLNEGFDISFYMREQGGSAVIADTSGLGIVDNQWHLVTMTYNGNSVVTYLDGLNVRTSGTSISNFVDWEYLPFPILAINSRGTMGSKFNGSVDDLKLYNYAFTTEEVAQMYYDVTSEKVCIYGNPAHDLSGNCVVDLADFAIIAENWLMSGFYPVD